MIFIRQSNTLALQDVPYSTERMQHLLTTDTSEGIETQNSVAKCQSSEISYQNGRSHEAFCKPVS